MTASISRLLVNMLAVSKATGGLDGNAGGFRVGITSGNDRTIFMHMQPYSNDHIKIGQVVTKYDIIGNVGHSHGYIENDPNAKHLHIQTFRNGKLIDPGVVYPYLDDLKTQLGNPRNIQKR